MKKILLLLVFTLVISLVHGQGLTREFNPANMTVTPGDKITITYTPTGAQEDFVWSIEQKMPEGWRKVYGKYGRIALSDEDYFRYFLISNKSQSFDFYAPDTAGTYEFPKGTYIAKAIGETSEIKEFEPFTVIVADDTAQAPAPVTTIPIEEPATEKNTTDTADTANTTAVNATEQVTEIAEANTTLNVSEENITAVNISENATDVPLNETTVPVNETSVAGKSENATIPANETVSANVTEGQPSPQAGNETEVTNLPQDEDVPAIITANAVKEQEAAVQEEKATKLPTRTLVVAGSVLAAIVLIIFAIMAVFRPKKPLEGEYY